MEYETIDENFDSKKYLGDVQADERGFPFLLFKDYYDKHCLLKLSSIALCAQPGASALWFGLLGVDPQIRAIHAAAHGIKTNQTVGWVPFPIPKEVSIATDMHLSRDQIAALIPVLQRWVETGELSV